MATQKKIKIHDKSTDSEMYRMGNLLYTLAVIMVIVWAIGFFAYSAGGLIHLLLVVAIVAVLLRAIRGSNPPA